MFFGGEIVRARGEVKSKRRLTSSKLKVHSIRVGPGVELVGLELSASTAASYQMLPVSLPPDEALALSRMLQEAAEYDSDSAAT